MSHAASHGVQEMVIGMAHRGRLNVLVNILGKPPVTLFEEFEGKHKNGDASGDVKYHQGYSRDVATANGPIHLTLGFNPSHLEIINPVIEGATRARQQRRADKQGKLAVPVLLHGDSAFAGQGVVMETLNLSQTRGYGTGGTVHIVINNQIGFTTSDPRDTRSTLYCTDVAKMVDAPVFHVNGDDPEAVLLVTQAALDFRMAFGKDVVIDLVCFRRLGHNEHGRAAGHAAAHVQENRAAPGHAQAVCRTPAAREPARAGRCRPTGRRVPRGDRRRRIAGQDHADRLQALLRGGLEAVCRNAVDAAGGHRCAGGHHQIPGRTSDNDSRKLQAAPDGGKDHGRAPRDGARPTGTRLGHGREPGVRGTAA